MKARECPRERETALAARRGALDEAAAVHARGCASCAEAAAVAAALASLSDDDVPARAPVDARVLWLKAQLAPRSADAAGQGPVSRGVIAVWVAVAASWAAFLTWRWPELRSLLETLTPQQLMAGSAGHASIPMASLGAVMLMAAVTLAIMLHQVFVEEL